ncbi:MAG: Cyclic pyranopterin monophosphate synthase [Betaproteobacteria bacterium ADurb.Bin341]|nr:MAG: Cyclic pyranopterin monophosphate synthase [Betaproteobacteria bacterium ADurb.Bin341]
MFDRFNRRIHYLRISVTDRCNLRCYYCMPPEGVPLFCHEDLLSLEEIQEFVAVAVELGVDKVRLTGGEPLLRRGIVALVKMLAEIPGIRDLAMTTNGTLLDRYAADLRAAGLMRVNVSMDSAFPERFAEITRGGKLDKVLEGIAAARAAGFEGIKLNCVIENSPDEEDARSVARFGAAEGLEVRYIHRMHTEQGIFQPVIGGEGGHCASCNRLRLTANGLVYPCLFSNQSWSVRQLGAREALLAAVAAKPESGQTSHHRFSQMGG